MLSLVCTRHVSTVSQVCSSLPGADLVIVGAGEVQQWLCGFPHATRPAWVVHKNGCRKLGKEFVPSSLKTLLSHTSSHANSFSRLFHNLLFAAQQQSRRVPLAVLFSPSGHASWWKPVGAIPTGKLISDPRSLVLMSIMDTSRSIRGRK